MIIKNSVKQFAKNGAFYIIGSSVLAQFCALLSSIFVVRLLDKTSYGFYVDANNIYSYFAIFIGLGFTSAVMQFCCESNDNNEIQSIYRFTFFKGMLTNILLFLLIAVFGLFNILIFRETVGKYLIIMSGLPFVVYANTYFQTVLRVKFKNGSFALSNSFYSISLVLLSIVLTRFIGTIGLIFANYIANIVGALVSSVFLAKYGFFKDIKSNNTLPNKQKKEIVKYSLYCAITNFTSTLLVLLDITCLNLVLQNQEVLADYKVATAIPTACLFISSCLIIYFYPYLVKRITQNNPQSIKQYILKLVFLFLAVNLPVFLILEIFAPNIITIIYGEKYFNVVPIFRVLGINFFIFASFRKLLGNIIAAFKAVKINLLHTTIAGIINIFLDIIMIVFCGSIGAAISTTLVTTFIIVMEVIYIFGLFRKKQRNYSRIL